MNNNIERRVLSSTLAGARQKDTPAWALDDKLLREVLVEYMERRAHGGGRGGDRWVAQPTTGTLTERLARAEAELMAQQPARKTALLGLCRQYRTEQEPARKHQLEIEIENLDTQLRITERFAEIAASVVYLYYRTNMDSVNVAEELGLKPPHVRQILYRLNEIWKGHKNANGRPRHDKRPNFGFDWKRADEMLCDGFHYSQIAKELNQSLPAVFEAMTLCKT